MPYLNVKLAASESAANEEKLAAALSGLTASILGKKQELTSIAIEYVVPEKWFVGGKSVSAQDTVTFYFEIKVTEGTNTKDEKSRYVHEVFATFEDIYGKIDVASYIVIHDVSADSWGFQGQTQEFRYIEGSKL